MVSRFFNTDLETCRLIPIDQLQVFLSRIEALQAHESLNLIKDLQTGGGWMKEKDYRDVTRELQERQKSLFAGAVDMQQKKERHLGILLSSGLPIGHLMGPLGIINSG